MTAMVGGSSSCPPRSTPQLSRCCTAVMPIESVSKTPVACGKLPNLGGSPVTNRILRMSQRGASQQVGLHSDQIAVAAAEVQDRLDAGPLQDPLTGDKR